MVFSYHLDWVPFFTSDSEKSNLTSMGRSDIYTPYLTKNELDVLICSYMEKEFLLALWPLKYHFLGQENDYKISFSFLLLRKEAINNNELLILVFYHNSLVLSQQNVEIE